MEPLTSDDLLFDGPDTSSHLLVLAHGAGAGMTSDFMSAIAHGVSDNGIKVCRFEFDYMRRRRNEGTKRPPDSQKKLEACWRRVIDLLDHAELDSFVIGGKSLGGRIASMLADELPCNGLVCLGYPFHPPGRPEELRTDHLHDLETRCLILQGERDPFGNREEAENYDLSSSIRIDWLPDGDHSFKPRMKSGHSLEENLARAIDALTEFTKNLPH